MALLFYRDPKLLLLTLGLVAVAGLSSYFVLPRMEDPAVGRRMGRIIVRYPGASAERVESLVTEKIEEQLREISEIDRLDSSSLAGASVIVIWLDNAVVDAPEVWSRVRDRLADATTQFPNGVSEPDFLDTLTETYTFIVALSWESDAPGHHAILRRLSESLEAEMQLVPGTEATELYGAADEEILVELPTEPAAALGLTIAEVAREIESTDAKIPSGEFHSGTNRMVIEVAGELDTLEQIAAIPVRRGTLDRVVRLGDIASVSKTPADPPSDLVMIGGRPAVALALRMVPGRQIDGWTRLVRERLESFRQQLSPGVGVHVLFDQSRYTEARLDGLFDNLYLGAALVLWSALVLMGWRSALLIGAALPLATLMSFAGMRALNVPLHQMSVTGLIIALGLLIDNAIVVVVELQGRLQRGTPISDAIGQTVRFLAVPLLGSTITTVLAFMPIILTPGPTGEFISGMAVVVVLALASSLFISLTVLPALSGLTRRSRLFRGERERGSDGFSHTRLLQGYRRLLDALLARPRLAFALAAAIPVIGFVEGSRMAVEFYPAAERDQFPVDIRLAPHASLEETKRCALRVDERIKRDPLVKQVYWFIGGNAPKFYYNEAESQSAQPNFAQALVQLHSAEDGETLIRRLQRELNQAEPSANILVRQLAQGTPIYAPIELRIYGPDLERLAELAELARAELSNIPDVTNTRVTMAAGQPKLRFRFDEDAARLIGLDNSTIARQLDGGLQGAVGGSLFETTEEIPVRVRFSKNVRKDVTSIAALSLTSPSLARDGAPVGDWIPLTSLGGFELVPEVANIAHRNGQRCNIVEGFVTAGVLSSSVNDQYRQRLQAINFEVPLGYRYEFGGDAAERGDAVADLMASIGVILVLMVATLVLCCGSFRHAAIICAVGVLAIGAGLFSLWLFRFPLGFLPIVGTMGLIGVAINDSIIVLAALRADPAALSGDVTAIREVVVGCTRHVVATTATTMAGFTPLILAGGSFWPPLAIVIAGGVVGATLLALVLVPAATLLMSRGGHRP